MMPNIWKAFISVPGPLNLQATEVLDQSLLHGHEMTSGEEPRKHYSVLQTPLHFVYQLSRGLEDILITYSSRKTKD